MSTEPENVLLDHAYDGIEEYDNPMPAWWVWLFVASIVFAPFYFIYYHMSPSDRSLQAELAADIENAKNSLPPFDESNEAFLGYLKDRAFLDAGKRVYDGICFSCYQPDGGGLVGPNMTDDYYLNVKQLSDFPEFIRKGNISKGMMPYEDAYSQRDIVRVSAYMASLRGTTPKVAKEPQGEIIPPWQ